MGASYTRLSLRYLARVEGQENRLHLLRDSQVDMVGLHVVPGTWDT